MSTKRYSIRDLTGTDAQTVRPYRATWGGTETGRRGGTTSEGALPANMQVAPPRGGLSARRSALAGGAPSGWFVDHGRATRLAGGAVTDGAG
ncbi:hypothetical protein [uncultured Porphyromonas sp.]|uniref:hypothetical protein n=1 Tax=uncultured Porphyromonas sp. TaxID=159274 RepID=UPI00266CD609|nr:hypothetical protein [uncultured Porphyromonas sp.]